VMWPAYISMVMHPWLHIFPKHVRAAFTLT
jgi:hypothetical protein